MSELSIIHEIAETVSQYEEELLYDVESNYHEYILQYDDIYENMSLTLKRSILHRRNQNGSTTNTTIEKYNITPKYVCRHINHHTKRPPTHHKKRMRNDRYKTHT